MMTGPPAARPQALCPDLTMLKHIPLTIVRMDPLQENAVSIRQRLSLLYQRLLPR